MIQAEVALAKAHKVVLKYCSLVEKDLKGKKKEGPDTVDSDLGLSLMVLGETLTNAKAKIVERVGFNVRGWHGDANEGWGTPSCVIKRMEDIGWCKRTVHMLEGQLRSHVSPYILTTSLSNRRERRRLLFCLYTRHMVKQHWAVMKFALGMNVRQSRPKTTAKLTKRNIIRSVLFTVIQTVENAI
jgi:hypothetical protein